MDTPGGMVSEPASPTYTSADGSITYRWRAPVDAAISMPYYDWQPAPATPDYPAPITYLQAPTGAADQPSPPPSYLDAIFDPLTNGWFNWRVTAIRGCQAVVFGGRVWMASGNCWPTFPVPPGPPQRTPGAYPYQ